jgi:hypothetical protein
MTLSSRALRAARRLVFIAAVFSGAVSLRSVFPAPRGKLNLSRELFDPTLQDVQTLDAAAAYIRAKVGEGAEAEAVAQAADTFVRQRFAEGYSVFLPQQNWLAYLAGFIWDDLRAAVLPDDILKHRLAACSQQAIVLQALLERFGVDYASVIFPGHFASAARIGGRWIYLDPHLEADQSKLRPVSDLRSEHGVKAIYESSVHYAFIKGIASQGRLTDINRFPAPQAAIFHKATQFFSDFGWLLLAFLWAAVSLGLTRNGRQLARSGPRKPAPIVEAQQDLAAR